MLVYYSWKIDQRMPLDFNSINYFKKKDFEYLNYMRIQFQNPNKTNSWK